MKAAKCSGSSKADSTPLNQMSSEQACVNGVVGIRGSVGWEGAAVPRGRPVTGS